MFPKVAPKFFKERSKGPVVFTGAEKKAAGTANSGGSYTVTVNGTDYAVSSSNGTFTVNGTVYAVSVKENVSSASMQKTAAAASASTTSAAPAAAQAAPVSKTATSAAPTTSKPAAASSSATSDSGVKLLAPVAGTLLRCTVAEGTKVSEGQTVIMLESMKMELEINAHKAGVIHFMAATGAQVAEGELLAEIR